MSYLLMLNYFRHKLNNQQLMYKAYILIVLNLEQQLKLMRMLECNKQQWLYWQHKLYNLTNQIGNQMMLNQKLHLYNLLMKQLDNNMLNKVQIQLLVQKLRHIQINKLNIVFQQQQYLKHKPNSQKLILVYKHDLKLYNIHLHKQYKQMLQQIWNQHIQNSLICLD